MTPVLATPHNMALYEAARPVAWSPTTAEVWSATPGDYWNLPAHEPLRGDDGEPLVLAREVCQMVPLGEES